MTKGNGKRWVERRHGWAIDTCEGRLLSVAWFRSEAAAPRHLRGTTTATFETRAEAREILPGVKKPGLYPFAKIVKLETTYRVIG